MEENKHIPMESQMKILRKSIYTFLRNYQYFTTTPLLLIFPFSTFILLSQTLFSSPSSPFLIIQCVFYSQMFKPNGFLNIFTFVFVLFLALTTLLLAKIIIIQIAFYPKLSPSIPFSLILNLLKTQLCNSLIMSILYIIFIILYIFFPTISSPNNSLFWVFSIGIFYSLFANANIVCNLALVVSIVENYFGFSAILKACSLSSTNTGYAILLTNLPTNLGMFAVEALFGYRIMRAHRVKEFFDPFMIMEIILIAYLYSILVILDTIATSIFFKSCEANDGEDSKTRYCYEIVVVDKQYGNLFEDSDISVIVQ